MKRACLQWASAWCLLLVSVQAASFTSVHRGHHRRHLAADAPDDQHVEFGGNDSQLRLAKLYKDKLHGGYDRHMRPIPDCSVYDCSHRIRVFMGLSFKKLVGLDQTSQTVTMVVQRRVTWPDYRLAYNASEYFRDVPFFGEGEDFSWDSKRDFLQLDQKLVWSPDIQLLDAVDEPLDITPDSRIFWYDSAKLHSEGYNMAVVTQQKVQINCDMDLTLFPFDKQSCKFRYGDWSASAKYFHFGTLDIGKIWSVPDVNKQFNIGKIEVTQSNEKYDLEDVAAFPEVVYTVVFQRYPHYYLLHFVFPQCILLLVAQSVFWLDLHGERHTVATGALLAVMTVSFLIGPLLPETNAVMWLERFQVFCYIMTTTPVFCSVLVEFYGYRSKLGTEWAARADIYMRVIYPLGYMGGVVWLMWGIRFAMDGDTLLFFVFNCIIFMIFFLSGLHGLLNHDKTLKAEMVVHSLATDADLMSECDEA